MNKEGEKVGILCRTFFGVHVILIPKPNKDNKSRNVLGNFIHEYIYANTLNEILKNSTYNE